MIFALLLAGSVPHALTQPLPIGAAQRTVDVAGTTIELHTYKPENYAGGPLLVTLHGQSRNADGYLAYSRPLADRYDLLVVAPRFDRERFPTWRYQTGGIARYARPPESMPPAVEPENRWTVRVVLDLIEAVRAAEGRPDLPYYLLGHSAGAQLLGRLAAFAPNTARRIVLANPGTYLWPSRDTHFPFGFGGLPGTLNGADTLQRYLAQPVTIFLGTADVEQDRSLNVNAGALQQGRHRHERGLNVFRAAQKVAAENGWVFNWRLVEAPGVGHSARHMLASPQAAAALF